MTPFNPVSTSGISFELEHYVQASFVASLLLQTPIPFGNGLLVTELNFQAKLIANVDDIIVHFSDPTKYFVQSKKGFEINSNEVFYEVIEFLWKDFTKPDFDQQNYKFIITTDVLSKADAENGLLVLEWARFSKDAQEFSAKLKSNKQKHAKYKYFLDAIKKANGGSTDKELVWSFLKIIYIKTYDYLESGSKDKEVLKWYLQPFIQQGNTTENALLSLLNYIQKCNQHGATLTKSNIETKIKDLFDLSKSPAISLELTEFIKKSSSQLQHTIQNELDGVHIDRSEYLTEISESLSEKKIVIISGEGGVGKSGLAKEYLEELFKAESGYLVFKADQLDRSSLANAFSDIGIVSDFETILSQWRLLPRMIIYIDSFEKLYESEHKEALLELLGKLKQANDNIKIVTTCRSFAIETLRLKYRISKDDVGIVELQPLTEKQLLDIAESKPKLKKIISNPKLFRLISLPFYLNIASQIIDSISNEELLDEAEFKKTLWEFIIKKKGAGKIGIGKKRAEVFSQIVLKRAKEKLPYIKPEAPTDIEIVSELGKEGLLIQHPKFEAYAPAHDIFEDMVVINHLNELFHTKTNSAQFLESIDSNPVFRRGLRQWIQELILQQSGEAKIFLSEIFLLYYNSDSMVDEILIGILGSDQAYSLIKQNADLFLKDNLKLFFKAFHLLKVAYTEPYKGEHPERKVKAKGNGWTALLKILDEHFEDHNKTFTAILLDLLYHWTLQFDQDDILPDEGKIVAKYSLQLLYTDKNSYRFDSKRRILEILFSVAPHAKDSIEELIKVAIAAKKTASTSPALAISFYKDFFEMLLVETFRCVNIYKSFPELIIELAKMEWYSSKPLEHDYDSDYLESSFGLKEYPYKYFNASAYQTPFRYLFKYHSITALSFLIELCNRGIEFYLKSSYAQQSNTRKITIILQDGSNVVLYGDVNLWATYRGMGSSPYLLQSALMAFELYLFEAAAADNISEDLLEDVIRKSNSILLIGVVSSIAMAYPLILKEKIFTILKIREFFAWDLNRYAQDFMSNLHTTIGNDPYYTRERHVSNELKHRKSNLENLVSKLQFYYPKAICDIIDTYKKTVKKDDNLWQLALTRMDMRNTTPEFKEEEGVVLFNPNPLPKNLQEYIDDGEDERVQDSSAITVFLWANKAFKQENDVLVTYETWKENYTKLRAIDFTKATAIYDSSKKLAAIGVKYFSEQLSDEEKEYCAGIIYKDVEQILTQLKLGYTHSALDVINDDNFSVLPILLKPEFNKSINSELLKTYIIDFIFLLPLDAKRHLIFGIRQYCWQIDNVFSHQCFQSLLKASKRPHLHYEIQRLRNLPSEKLSEEVDQLLAALKIQPEIEARNIDLHNDYQIKISLALETVPYVLLGKVYRQYLNQILIQISNFENIENRNNEEFIRSTQVLLANYLIHNSDDNSANTLTNLLSIRTKQFCFVMDTLKWFVWVGHDKQYPLEFWFHINVLMTYVFNESPTIGFIHVLLLEPLKNVYRCNKINEIGPGRKLHELIISEYAADKNLIEAVFKLLAGVGSVYQPLCLTWLMKSLPYKKTYEESLSVFTGTSYITEFVNQLYTNHIDHIRMNKEQMDYFIMLLNLLIDRGSTLAFRIRDELI